MSEGLLEQISQFVVLRHTMLYIDFFCYSLSRIFYFLFTVTLRPPRTFRVKLRIFEAFDYRTGPADEVFSGLILHFILRVDHH